jgi:hypothetical protein
MPSQKFQLHDQSRVTLWHMLFLKSLRQQQQSSLTSPPNFPDHVIGEFGFFRIKVFQKILSIRIYQWTRFEFAVENTSKAIFYPLALSPIRTY